MSQDFFQCLVCSSLFGTLWKVEKHIKQHETDSVNGDRSNVPSSGSRRGMLPIKKVAFLDCFVPVVKNQIDPAFLEQYNEIQAKDEPFIKEEGDVAANFLSLEYNNGFDDDDLLERNQDFDEENLLDGMDKKPRRSQRRAVANIRRAAAAILKIPDQPDATDDQDDDMEYVQDLLDKLSDEEEDDDFKPPTYISQKYEATKRKVGRPAGSKVKRLKKIDSPSPKLPRAKKSKKKGKKKNDSEKCHPCEYCSESFSQRHDLYQHLYENHQDDANMITCPVKHCDRPFLNYASLRSHFQQHNNAERREWAVLEQVKNQSSSQNNSKEEEPDFSPDNVTIHCKFCLDKFESLKSLQSHIAKVHTSDSSILKCPCCEKDTKEEGVIRFIGHMKGCHPERLDPFNERHKDREIRLKEKRFTCDKCNATFAFNSNLQKHIEAHKKREEKHSQEEDDCRRFACPVCEKKFKYKDNLRRHFTLHLENNPYTCDFPDCNRKFNSDYNLRRHKALHFEINAEAQRVHCPLCDASFSRKDKLPRHLREFHKPSDINGPSPAATSGVKKQRHYQNRLPHCSRIRKVPTYRDLEQGNINKEQQTAGTTGTSTPSGQNSAWVSVKTEGNGQSTTLMEEIHLVDRIILGLDGNAVHIKGEHLSPQKVSTNVTPRHQEKANSFSAPAINMTNLSKLIVSDPLFERLSKEDPKKVQDILTANYNYKQGRSFNCQLCEAVFTRAWTLQLHLKTQHKQTILDQNQTLATIASGDAAGQNVTLMCGECAYPAKDAKDLENHMKLSHKPKVKCFRCGLFFECHRSLKHHVKKIHKGTRDFNCRFCTQTFTSLEYLRNHERRVHENSDKPRVMKRCPVEGCHKMVAPSSYPKHMKTHRTPSEWGKKHKCMLCGDVLCNPMALRRHIDAIHLGKPINRRKKGQGLKEAGPPSKGTTIRRGPKANGDEWFHPLLEKALGITPTSGKKRQQEPDTQNGDTNGIPDGGNLEPVEENGDDDLMSILGF